MRPGNVLRSWLACLLLLTACQGPPAAPGDARDTQTGASRPADAVRELTAHLRNNDLQAFARDALPPALHAELEQAWQRGQTRWPLEELPLSPQHPRALAALSADQAEVELMRTFDRQFRGASGDLRKTVQSLGIFAVQFVQQRSGYSDSERQHFGQLLTTLSRWAAGAPLTDRKRAQAALALLIPAARQVRLDSDAAFAEAGMDESLRRMGGMVAATKQAIALYGLDLDASLADMQVQMLSQTGDLAKVRMRYSVAGSPIDTIVPVQRYDGRWYVADFVDNARAAVAAAEGAAPPAPATPDIPVDAAPADPAASGPRPPVASPAPASRPPTTRPAPATTPRAPAAVPAPSPAQPAPTA